MLAFYSHPALDDFAIGTALRTQPILSYTWDVYMVHSGRFSSSLFSAVFLLFSFYPSAYPYLIFGFIGLFCSGLFVAAAALVPGPQQAKSLTGSTLVILGLSYFPWPAEGLFWLTGAVAYLTPLFLTCGLLILLARQYSSPEQKHHSSQWLLIGVLGLLIPGFSEISALLLLLVSGALWVLPDLRPVRWQAHWVGIAITTGCLLTLLAPGNFQRLHARPGHQVQVVHSVILALTGTTYLLINWIGSALLLALTMVMLPVSQATARYKGRSLLNRLTTGPIWLWPLLLLTGLFGSVWFCYTVQGIGPALRVKNILYFYFLICWFLSTHAVVGRYAPAWQLYYPTAWPLRGAAGITLICLFFTDHNHNLLHDDIGRAPNTVVQAYRDWLSGDARRYHQTQKARYQQLRTISTDSVQVLPLPTRPRTLFYYDISYNPALWGNQAYAQFFGKKAVWVQPPPEAR
ncbi:hypothetical protein HW554_09830 [Hymenobacter sp. P5342]|uniref:DUF2723 domain-containing protein n=1 Tax=Hymenobacter lapidiphilus TaxID=2608003 RepID=A0A7Y7PPJ6_9BACT|nr:hypothetical protein [Hymenobacter lapidiphilus]